MHEIVLDTAFGRLAGLRTGRPGAPRVLALHGWLDNAASFEPLSPWLQALDFAAIDLPGHGASAHLPAAAEYTLVAAARAALHAADALGWDRFAVLGHSMGGATATLLAAAAPARVSRLLLIEALGGLTEAEDRTAARLREAFAAQAGPAGSRRRVFADIAMAVRARRQAGELGEEAARRLVQRNLAPVDGGYVWRSDARLTRATAVRMSEAQMRDVVASIECPVRLLHAEPAYRYFPEDVRTSRAALLRDAEVIGIPGGHHLHMDAPELVAPHIAGFFEAR